VIVVVESTDYNRIMAVNPPNILSLDVHPAIAWGLGSRASCGAIIGGILNVCQLPSCYHREIKSKWNNPFFMSAVKEVTEWQFLACPNGWSLELLLPFIQDEEQRRLNFKWHDSHASCPFREQVDVFLRERKKYDSYFALLWAFEPHAPYYYPGGTGDPDKSLLFVDEQIGRVLDECGSEAEIVIESDHGIPESPEKGAVFSLPMAKTMLSFIATNFRETKSFSELGINPYMVARKRWL